MEGTHFVHFYDFLPPGYVRITITDNDVAYLVVQSPSTVAAGYPVRIIVSSATTDGSPPPALAGQSLSLTAERSDLNPSPDFNLVPDHFGPIADGASSAAFDVTFPASVHGFDYDYSARFTITATDGTTVSATSPEIRVIRDTSTVPDFDGDGILDVVESALGSSVNQRNVPPLTVSRDDTGAYHAILAQRPRNPSGWSVVIELSTDLQKWAAAPAASITITNNTDGVTEKVDVLLPSAPGRHYARLKATKLP